MTASPTVALIMPLGVWNETSRECLVVALGQLGPGDESIAVFDGFDVPSDLPGGVRGVRTTHCSGPGIARNLGASVSSADVLLFVDADVRLHAGTLERLRRRMADVGLDAAFGAYDAAPRAPGLVSRFRNLLHHYEHHRAAGRAYTFWAGCGAVRREVFFDVGGFPGIRGTQQVEDVAFGLQLHRAGRCVELDPGLSCTHLKAWTLLGMLDADLRKRAIPWTRLLWREGAAARTLNAGWRGQICVVATGLMWLLLVFGVLAWGASGTLAFVMGLMAGFVPHLLHLRFLRLLWRSGGLALFATGVVLLPLFWSVAGLGFLVGSFRRDPHAGVAAPDQ